MFLKRVGDGSTRWHSDLHMAPFDTNSMVTVWVPFDAVPHPDAGGTGLCFATGSHRDFALPFWSRPHEKGADFSARCRDLVLYLINSAASRVYVTSIASN
jgi:ectoine hydroxylase-related dioxygenase (phytanoyl-CoA dioxygenase family)